MLSVGALAASSGSRMLRFDSLARKLKLASARPLGAPYVGPWLRRPERASRERESHVRSSVVSATPTLHPDYIRYLLAVGSPPLSPTRSAPRRAVARHYCREWNKGIRAGRLGASRGGRGRTDKAGRA